MTNTGEFEEFMRNHQNMVFATAVRLVGNETDAADIAQEVFLRAYRHFAEISTSTRRAGWLKTVTTNLCLNHLSRYRSRWRFFSEMFDPARAEEDFSASIPSPESNESRLTQDDQQAILQAALLRLPAAQRVPLVLYHFEEMSYEQIADQLDVSLGKVKTDIRRARETLRKKLKWTAEGELAAPARPESIGPRPSFMGCI
jgi:RNA polymerase sigma-70 factor (ECF subfamily)